MIEFNIFAPQQRPRLGAVFDQIEPPASKWSLRAKRSNLKPPSVSLIEIAASLRSSQ
ncbi:MAG: hypothetical protein WA417_11735 [Stellaceae bacterium]